MRGMMIFVTGPPAAGVRESTHSVGRQLTHAVAPGVTTVQRGGDESVVRTIGPDGKGKRSMSFPSLQATASVVIFEQVAVRLEDSCDRFQVVLAKNCSPLLELTTTPLGPATI